MNCTYHIQSPISMICIAPHKCQCQRKLCVECCYDHGVDQKYIVSAVKFQDMTQKILKDSELNDTSELTKQRMHFKSMLAQTEQMMKKIWDELSLSIKQVFDWIEKENQSILNLYQENCNIAECSSTDLEKLVQIVEGRLLIDWSVQRNSYFTRFSNIWSYYGQEFQKYSEKIRKKSKELIHRMYQTLKPNQQLNEYTNIFVGIFWDYSYNQPLQLKLNLQITFTQDKEIQYIKDGYKIRIDKIKETTRKPGILTNLEQIQHLYWSGNYGQKNQKIGNWLATWKGEKIQGVGGKYSDDGQKQGKWREIQKNYWSLGKVFEEGEYVKDQRIAVWKYIYENNEIGGGGYNTEGLKIGKWIDLSEGFWQYSQLTQNGQYRNGKKVGRWDIFYREQSSDSFKQIGGGQYDETGNELKMGNWVEISDNFTDSSQVIYKGEYQNGKKIGKWDIQCRKEIDQPFKIIGGGLYDEKGDVKFGYWEEISDKFRDFSQIIYKGDYINGQKIGRWNIEYRKDFDDNFQNIGGGQYDVEGDELKIGNWAEISDNFTDSSQVIYKGEYQNGKKIGRWDIQCRKEIDQPFKIIGGGLYDEKGDVKFGYWEEISDKFRDFSQIIYKGDYINGQKIGRWNIESRKDFDDNFQNIGGGQYIKRSNTAKVFYDKQILNNEIEDCKDESDYWDFLNEKFQKISEQQIDVDKSCQQVDGGVKFGKWIELHDGFMNSSQVTFHGQYENGRKVNRWDIILNKNGKQQSIGGGFYDYKEGEDYSLVKLGNWIELDDGFNDFCQITYQGEYLKNKKVGRWDSYFQGIQIGGGLYNENGQKHGKWTLLSDNFFIYNLITYIGSFQDGEKVGQWDTMKIQIQDDNLIFEKIGQKIY